MGVITTGPNTIAATTSLGNRLRRGVAQFSNGNLIAVAGQTLWISTDGMTWTSATGTVGSTTGFAPAELFVDADDYTHVVGMAGNAVEYWRGTPNTERTDLTWDGPHIPQSASTQAWPSLVAHRSGDGWAVHIVWSRYWSSSSSYKEYRCRCVSTSIHNRAAGCTASQCPSHGHTTYTSWTRARPSSCACGTQNNTPRGCHTDQYGWHTGSCPCSHLHRCSSGTRLSRTVNTGSNTDNRTYYARYQISADGTVALQQSAITISRDYNRSDHTMPIVDFHHAGDAKLVSGEQPDLYVAWVTGLTGSSYGLRYRKATHSAGAWTWGTEQAIDSALNPNSLSMSFDGTRIVVAADHGSSPYVKVWERDSADTTSTTRTPPALSSRPSGVAVSYGTDGNIILAAEHGGQPKLVTYERVSDTWGEWAVIEATNVVGSPTSLTVNGGGLASAAYIRGTSSPYDVRYWSRQTTRPPSAPSWTNTSGPASVSLTLPLAWVFHDPDPGDTQTAFALRRRVGTAAAQYWTGATWLTTEDAATKQATSTTGTALPANWGLATDDTHYYTVKVWDSRDEGPSEWSLEVAATPGVSHNPTVGAIPTVPTASYELTWTVTQQTGYQIRTFTDDTGSPGDVTYDSGHITSTSTNHIVPFPTQGAQWVELVTWNTLGLASVPALQQVTVAYEGPSAPLVIASPWTGIHDTEPSGIQVDITAPNPNLIDRQTSTFEETIGGWVAGLNTPAITRDTTVRLAGQNTLKVATAVAAGASHVAATPTGTSGIPIVDPTVDHVTRVDLWVSTAADQGTQLAISYYDTTGTELTVAGGTADNNITGEWVEVATTTTPPSGAAFASIALTILGTVSAGSALWATNVAVFEADDPTSTAWRAGHGRVLTDTVDVLRRPTALPAQATVAATGLGRNSQHIDHHIASGTEYEYLGRAWTASEQAATVGDWTS